LAEHGFHVGGNVEDEQRAAGVVREGWFQTQMVQHLHLENHTAYAYMDDLEHIVIVSSTQIPHIARRLVGEALDIPLSRVRVIKPYLGGGFGNKQDVVLEPMVAFLTMKLGGRPVKITLEREEGMTGSRVRHPIGVHLQVGADESGRLTFLDLEATSNTGAYASHGHSVVSAGVSKAHYLYPRAAYRCRARTVYTNLPAAGAMRAYGSPQIIFAIESLMDDLALAVGLDPVDFRLKNVARPGDLNQLSKKPILSAGVAECLEQGRIRIDWDRKKREWPQVQTGPIRRGLGVACFSYASGTFPVCVEVAGARLRLNQDGSVHLMVGATEIGQGADTIFAQMAAQTLGVAVDRVHVVSTQDTDTTPFDTGAYASRQTYVGGQAVHKTALSLKRKILAYAGTMTGQNPDHLDMADGLIFLKGAPDRPILTLKDLALDSYYHKTRGELLVAEESHKTQTNAPSYGCTFVDLEVDIPLCWVRIHEIFNIHDAGRLMNPQTSEGQVHGGLAMGLGGALFEELSFDPATGRSVNANLLDYKVPTIMDVPDLGAGFVETFEPTGAYGAKSLGEPPLLTPAPAVRNAILNATGVRINDLPMTPKALFVHFQKAGLIPGGQG
jgi:xanthine dehydrogenase molybdenum-binding subunit